MKNTKNNIIIAGLCVMFLSNTAHSQPYSVWKNEHEHSGQDFSMKHADTKPLSYSDLVDEYYNGNYPQVQMQVALSFETGINETPINKSEAMNWYNRAAINGNTDAAIKLYEYSLNSNGKPTSEGFDMLKWSAEQENKEALYILANYYIRDEKPTDENLKKALNLYKKSFDLGKIEAESKIHHIEGELRKRDTQKAWNEFWEPFRFSE